MSTFGMIAGDGPPRKKTRRGKSKAKPGGHHLSNLTAAHSKGDFAAAKLHALNYANAVHKHVSGPVAQPMAMGSSATEPDADDAGENQVVTQTPAGAPAPNPRARLAAIAMRRRA